MEPPSPNPDSDEPAFEDPKDSGVESILIAMKVKLSDFTWRPRYKRLADGADLAQEAMLETGDLLNGFDEAMKVFPKASE